MRHATVIQSAVRKLATSYGLLCSYKDVHGRTHSAQSDVLLAVLKSLGALVSKPADAPEALHLHVNSLWQTAIEPIVVAWQGRRPVIEIRIPAAMAGRLKWTLRLEAGDVQTGLAAIQDLPPLGQADVDGTVYVARQLTLPGPLEFGYHHLQLDLPSATWHQMIVSAPAKAYAGEDEDSRLWGTFLPLHALHRKDGWPAGDIGDLDALLQWIAQHGGSMVQVLPMLAELRELGDGPAPYGAASRLFWDPFYLDVEYIEHLVLCPQARKLLAQAQPLLQALRTKPLVDYAAQMQLKRRVLESLADWYCQSGDQSQIRAFARANPLAHSFARFRATGERQNAHWPRWPERLKSGRLKPADYDPRAYRYHLYSQWQIAEQIRRLADRARSHQAGLCLDFPIGVSRDGFDAWAHRDLFIQGMGIGAPGDAFFPGGQNWLFPPVHPQRQREQHYSYFLACLRHHLRCAGYLRLDHVMGLHRLYWIPDGLAATDGVYVRYPADEMLAILTLESIRSYTMIIGENLGTVPPAVNRALRRHGLCGMYILPFEIAPRSSPQVRGVPADCLAGLNTHDMPTFTAFWTGLDIDEKLRRKSIDHREARQQHHNRGQLRRALLAHLKHRGFRLKRNSPTGDVFKACLLMLAGEKARIVSFSMEDVWGEKHSQNIPGVAGPNWRHKARYNLEQVARSRKLADLLADLGHARASRHD